LAVPSTSLTVLALSALALPAYAADAKRSQAVRAEFQRENPCPSTGATRGKCPGYQADHRIAICAGGADRAGNLQWLTIEDHKRKTKRDVMECRSSGR
jgi:hypothetical protein